MTESPCLGHGIALRAPAGGVVLKRPLLCNVSREVPGRLAMGERDAESPAVVKIAAACPQETRTSVGGRFSYCRTAAPVRGWSRQYQKG